MSTSLPTLLHFSQINPEPWKQITVADTQIPFAVKRIYWVAYHTDTIFNSEHANRTQHQIIIPLQGILNVELTDTTGKSYHYTISDSGNGLYIPPMYWKKLQYHQHGILLCLSSDSYNEADYVRRKEDFLP